jgi:hypothetical protein
VSPPIAARTSPPETQTRLQHFDYNNGMPTTHDYSQLGYCTNVHAGADWETTRGNLERYALAVKARVSPRGPMGVGLWLSANAAAKLLSEKRVEEFGNWLRDVGLVPYTFNGFPHGDFHQEVVKHRVYHPTWWEPSRLEYTLDLVAIQHSLLPPGMEGSISTLPIAWGNPTPSHEQLMQAAMQLRKVSERLARLERESGRFICLCLEPEPGCFLQRSKDVMQFFHQYLWAERADEVRRYIRVCHDVCHAAVMFEPQADVFRAYKTAAIEVGKVQISCAVATPRFELLSEEERVAAFTQLRGFHEPRYLHQTVVLGDPEGDPEFYEDLSKAIQYATTPAPQSGEWRVHFHVPIYLQKFGHLRATQDDILECLRAARKHSNVRHFEVETYAWGVLPPELRQPDLAAGIAKELKWFVDQVLN